MEVFVFFLFIVIKVVERRERDDDECDDDDAIIIMSPNVREKRKKSEAAVLHLKNVKNTQKICRLAHFFRKRPKSSSLLITPTTSEEVNEEDF